MQNDITVIATDLLAAEKTQQVLQELDMEYRVVNADIQELKEIAVQQVASGAKVLITFGMFAKLVRRYVSVPVIMVDLQTEDILDGILQASRMGKKIGIVGFRQLFRNIYYVRELLTVELKLIPTVLPEEIPAQLAQAGEMDVLVGGYYQVRVAKSMGIPSVLINPRNTAISRAIMLAKAYLEKREVQESSEGAVQESSVYATIVVDRERNIQMMNHLASKYLMVDKINAVAFSVDDVCPQFSRISDVFSSGRAYLNQIAKIGERLFLYHAEPILDRSDGSLGGVSVTFQDSETVQRSEISIRRKLNTKENQATYSFEDILGNSPCMNQVMKLALRYSQVSETVLILGETGVGKELFAQGIHRASSRRDKPFVAVNCAALPESILESELFGYEKGAFTGANREGKRGLFEYAHQGTIFLDEIGEISPLMQGKLLRVLQEQSIRRIGGKNPIPIDVRIITATNRDLISMVREGSFRADLYFRINVLGLCIPPLRRRQEDILLLAEFFLREMAQKSGRRCEFSEAAKALLLRYSWPGNVRELQNMVRRVSVISESEVIDAQTVEMYMQENRGLLPESEREEVSYTPEEALAICGGNKVRAAKLMGISRATFYRRLDKKEE